MKIGILGGTLDPVHNGHIEIALAAMAALGLEEELLWRAQHPAIWKQRETARKVLDALITAQRALVGCLRAVEQRNYLHAEIGGQLIGEELGMVEASRPQSRGSRRDKRHAIEPP